jgi:hypothetical protein
MFISDLFSSSSHIQFKVENGCFTDTIGGLAHLDEHLLFGENEKYELYSMFKQLDGIYDFNGNALTYPTFQINFITVPHFKYDNFRLYKNNQITINFEKSSFYEKTYEQIFHILTQNYRLYGNNQILTIGTPSESDYDGNKLKKYLNNMKYEKSLFVINTNINTTNFLESQKIKKLKYYNKNFIIGKMPNNFKEIVNSNNIFITNLNIGEINHYLNGINETDIPCYKKEPNKCKELNEFDFEKQNE